LRLAADWRHSSTSHTCVMPLYIPACGLSGVE